MNRYLMVFNPAAGGLNRTVIDQVRHTLQAAGKTVDLYETRAPGDAIGFLQGDSWQADVVVAIGGDGTVNEVINGLRGKSAILAVIPQGTTNVLAMELALPRQAAAITAMLLAGKTLQAHAARMNGQRFLLMAGVGYDARVVAGVDLALKKRIGKGAYVLSMLREIARYGRYHFDYQVDNGPWLPAASLIITNGKYYGGSFVLSRTTTLTSPHLQVFAFTSASRWKLLFYQLMLPLGLMERAPGIRVHTAQRIAIRAAQPDVIQVDGDVAGTLPVDIVRETDALTIMVP